MGFFKGEVPTETFKWAGPGLASKFRTAWRAWRDSDQPREDQEPGEPELAHAERGKTAWEEQADKERAKEERASGWVSGEPDVRIEYYVAGGAGVVVGIGLVVGLWFLRVPMSPGMFIPAVLLVLVFLAASTRDSWTSFWIFATAVLATFEFCWWFVH